MMSYFTDEEGSALILVLFLLIVFAELVALLCLNCRLNFKLAVNMEEYKQAVYAAEAGIEYGKYVLTKNNGIPRKNPDDTPYSEGDNYGDQITLDNNILFTVSFIEESEARVLITAKGYYKNNHEELKQIVVINN